MIFNSYNVGNAGATMTRLDDRPEILVTLPQAELDKVEPASDEEILAALKKGREDRASFEATAQPAPVKSRIRYS